MGKIKETFQKMSLKKSLLILAVFWLSLVGVLSIATILKCSDIRQEILDTRPIIIMVLLLYRKNIRMGNFQKKIKYIIGVLLFLWCLYP